MDQELLSQLLKVARQYQAEKLPLEQQPPAVEARQRVLPPRLETWGLYSSLAVIRSGDTATPNRSNHSSRSFLLGVLLGSLARKPNMKIPMKKKTTE